MKSFKHYITEVFDKPYEWKFKENLTIPTRDYMKGNFKGKVYSFFPADDGYGEVVIYEYDIVGPHSVVIPGSPQQQGRAMEMHFAVDSWLSKAHGTRTMSGEITGEGDAMRIFATVLDIVKSKSWEINL